MEHIPKKIKLEGFIFSPDSPQDSRSPDSPQDSRSPDSPPDPPPDPFTQEGVDNDEITLDFDEKKLFVPKNFLTVASPVFEAIFRNDFTENKEGRVQMKGKSYEDCLEFLLCIHPRILKEVDEVNILRIAPLADEYQVTAIISKCKTAMESMLSNAQDEADSTSNRAKHLKPLRECFNVLKSAMALNYSDMCDLSLNAIARFGYCLYNDMHYNDNVLCYQRGQYVDKNRKERCAEVRNECISLSESLPLELRYRIISDRLNKINNNEFK